MSWTGNELELEFQNVWNMSRDFLIPERSNDILTLIMGKIWALVKVFRQTYNKFTIYKLANQSTCLKKAAYRYMLKVMSLQQQGIILKTGLRSV